VKRRLLAAAVAISVVVVLDRLRDRLTPPRACVDDWWVRIDTGRAVR
jgi:hypothetical protein